jgi:pyridoxal phosphate enzyme (YggS family)
VTALDTAVAQRLAEVRTRIAAAGGVGVEVLAVTKTFGFDAVVAARNAGCRAIGENYAQEVVAKLGGPEHTVPDGLAVHFIGRLQTNKVRQLIGIVDVWETVDRASVIDVLAKRAPGATVLIQVDPTGEPGKGGCASADVPALVRRATSAGITVRGLMTVGPTEGGPEAAREGFRVVRALVDDLGLTVCSMGMSADLEVAVEEGSTEVRIGSALFGPRVGARVG